MPSRDARRKVCSSDSWSSGLDANGSRRVPNVRSTRELRPLLRAEFKVLGHQTGIGSRGLVVCLAIQPHVNIGSRPRRLIVQRGFAEVDVSWD